MDNDLLPYSWTQCTLGEVIETIRGVSYAKEQSSDKPQDGYVPILRATNIDQRIHFDDFVFVPAKQVSDEQMLKLGDIVIAASSGSKSVVGKAAQLSQDWDGSFGAFCMAIRPNPAIEPRFVGLFLQSHEYRNRVSKLAAGSNINNLKRDHIESFPFRLAPVGEQRRLSDKIDELFSDLDAGVVALERARANLKRYRAAVLKAAVEGKLTEQWRKTHPDVEPASKLLERILAERRKKWEEVQLAKFTAAGKAPPKGWKDKFSAPSKPDTSSLPELPEGWCWATMEQVGEIQLGRQRSPKNVSKHYPTKYLRAANITELGLDLSDVLDMEFQPHEKQNYLLRDGDLILSEASGSPMQVGKPAIWRSELNECCFQNTVIRLRPGNLELSTYLLNILRAFYINGVFARTATGVGINHLSAHKFAKLPIPFAPLREQAEVVAQIEVVFSTITHSELGVVRSDERASRLRQAILKRAFEGKLVPQDPNDEPASVLLERIRNARTAEGPQRVHKRRKSPA